MRLCLFFGLGTSCSVASKNAVKPGNISSSSAIDSIFLTLSYSFLGRGKTSRIRGSMRLMFLRTPDWLTPKRYESSVDEVYRW